MTENPPNKAVRGTVHKPVTKEERAGLHALLDRALDDGPSDVVVRLTSYLDELIAGAPKKQP